MAKVVYNPENPQDSFATADLLELGTLARVGQAAPLFQGTAYHNGSMVSLELQKLLEAGKWTVLFFYPADFTFVCPTELQDLQRAYAEFQKLGVEVIGISTDTEWAHKVWVETSPMLQGLSFPLFADPTGDVSRAYGVYIADAGLADRGRFIIDPEGTLRSLEIVDGGCGRNIDEILRQIRALQYMAQHPGEVCPLSFSQNGQTLKPGVELAGKL